MRLFGEEVTVTDHVEIGVLGEKLRMGRGGVRREEGGRGGVNV